VLHAPLNPSAYRVLDIGCGTGAVTAYLGRKYPGAEVYGIDLWTVPPLEGGQPDNVSFVQGNFMDTRDPRLGDRMDFCFSRLLIMGMRNWRGYVSKVHGLKPGRWAEMQDAVLRFFGPDGVEMKTGWIGALRDGAHAGGMDWNCGGNVAEVMRGVGFEGVRRWEYMIPLGTWDRIPEEARQSGEFDGPVSPGASKSLIGKMLKGTYDEDEIEEFKTQAREDIERQPVYIKFAVTVGRKSAPQMFSNTVKGRECGLV